MDFLERLKLAGACIDFLYSHRELKPSGLIQGIFLMRHTILFNKTSDTLSRQQQRNGVGKVNRGTGITARRLSRADASLAKIGYVTVTRSERIRHGSVYTICVENILLYVSNLRAAGSNGASQQLPETSNDNDRDSAQVRKVVALTGECVPATTPQPAIPKGPSPSGENIETLCLMLGELIVQLRPSLDVPNSRTCGNLLRLAMTSCPEAKPEEIVWFLREKLTAGGLARYQSWGGVHTAVREDFQAWWIRLKGQKDERTLPEDPPERCAYFESQLEQYRSALNGGNLVASTRERIELLVRHIELELGRLKEGK